MRTRDEPYTQLDMTGAPFNFTKSLAHKFEFRYDEHVVLLGCVIVRTYHFPVRPLVEAENVEVALSVNGENVSTLHRVLQ
jgi:hypothetical protein